MKRIYLDYAATTPVDPRVLQAMLPYFGVSLPHRLTDQPIDQLTDWGNPGSLHQFGQRASAAVFASRQKIAAALGCLYQEIVFTGSATEANNLALRGALAAYKLKAEGAPAVPRIIISAIEHESVLNTAKDLMKDGVDVVIMPVSKDGIVDLKKLRESLNEQTVLVSVMYANNETGTVQPVTEISRIVKEFRGAKTWPLVHTDAVQAFQYAGCNVDELGVDLMTLSAQKIYGPKGIGALYVRSTMRGVNRSYPIRQIITGGGQEHELRSGTENAPAIVGFAKAVELVEATREKEVKRITALRNYAWQGIKKIFPKAALNGPSFAKASKGESRLPNNLSFHVPHVSGEQMLVSLDLKGIAISSGSACTARSIDPSHVLLAMGHDKVRAKNSLRITFGRQTTRQEITSLLKSLKEIKA